MSFKIEQSAKGFVPDEKLNDYVVKKIGRLDRFVGRHARRSAHAEVRLEESKKSGKKSCQCEVVLHLPNDILTAKEATINIYAAVDIIEEKLKMQLKKYHEIHTSHRRGIKQLIAKIKSPF